MIEIILGLIIIIAVAGVIYILGRRLPDVKKQITPAKEINHFLPKAKQQKPLEQADELFQQKKYHQAEQAYVNLAASEPRNPKIYNRLGALYLEQENFSDAKVAFNEALKYDKKIASRWYNLGLACLGLQELRSAADAFEKAAELDKNKEKYSRALQDTNNKLKKFIVKKH